MKKTTIILFSLISFLLVFNGCKKDEVSPVNEFPGVPASEIVPVEEREAVLTRSSESFKSTNTLNFWTYAEAKMTVTGCGNTESLDYFADQGIDPSSIKISFGADYKIYTQQNGVTSEAGGWSWDNTSTKNGIILDKYPSVVFTFTALNKNEVVYASKQTGANESCNDITSITYERVVAQ